MLNVRSGFTVLLATICPLCERKLSRLSPLVGFFTTTQTQDTFLCFLYRGRSNCPLTDSQGNPAPPVPTVRDGSEREVDGQVFALTVFTRKVFPNRIRRRFFLVLSTVVRVGCLGSLWIMALGDPFPTEHEQNRRPTGGQPTRD